VLERKLALGGPWIHDCTRVRVSLLDKCI
jgi:hypothetical protein